MSRERVNVTLEPGRAEKLARRVRVKHMRRMLLTVLLLGAIACSPSVPGAGAPPAGGGVAGPASGGAAAAQPKNGGRLTLDVAFDINKLDPTRNFRRVNYHTAHAYG